VASNPGFFVKFQGAMPGSKENQGGNLCWYWGEAEQALWRLPFVFEIETIRSEADTENNK
jgi:hypothetical protein